MAWAAAIAVFTALAAPAGASVASSCGASEEPAELCGRTTITASGSAVVRVHLAEPIEIDPVAERMRLFDLTGEARAMGFALVPEEDTSSNGYLVGGRIRSGSPEASTFLLGVNPVFGASWYDGAPLIGFFVSPVTLGAGTYRLSLFTDAPSLRLTLHLPGLTGSSEFAATSENGAIVRFPDPAIPPSSPAAQASSSAALVSPGLTIGAALIETDALVASQYVLCRRMAIPNGQHGCEDRDPGTANDPGLTIYNDRNPAPAGATRLLVHSTGMLPATPIGLGFVNTVEGVVRARSFVAIWLPLSGV